MASTPIFRFNNQAFALACAGVSAVGPVTVTANSPLCAFWNTTSTPVAVTMTVLTAVSVPPNFSFPVNGVPSGAPSFILPPGMDMPLVVSCPPSGFNVFAIAASTGNPSIQFSPAEMQS